MPRNEDRELLCDVERISLSPHALRRVLEASFKRFKAFSFHMSPQGSPGLDRKQFLHWSLAVQLALTDES